MAITVEELVTVWGFKVDRRPLDQVKRGIGDIKSALTGLSIAFTAVGAGIAVFAKAGGEFEQTKIAFETILGSAELAEKKLAELSEFARRTPFTLPGVERNAKQLLAVGIETDKLVPTLKTLGDVASGLSVPLERIVLNFGQIKTQGKLTGRELRDFAIAGVPLIDELAKNLGVAKNEIASLVATGSISFDQVEKAFITLTSGSGRFADLMDKQSRSFFGILSNIKDDLILISREIGLEMLPQLKELGRQFRLFVGQNRDLIKSKLKDFFKDVGGAIKSTIKFLKRIGIVLSVIAKPFGGIEKLLIGLIKGFLFLQTLKIASGFGRIAFAAARVATGLGRFLGFLVRFKTIAKSAGLLRTLGVGLRFVAGGAIAAQAAALAVPLAIAAAVVALALLADDLIAFFSGDNSVTGKVLKSFQETFPGITEIIKTWVEQAKASFGLMVAAFNFLKVKLQPVFDFISEKFKGLVDLLKDLNSAFTGFIKKIGKKILVKIFGADFDISAGVKGNTEILKKITSGINEATENAKRSQLTGGNLGPALLGGSSGGGVNNNNSAKAEITVNTIGMSQEDSIKAVESATEKKLDDLLRVENRSAIPEVRR
jgi:tape measure domain-containing protein